MKFVSYENLKAFYAKMKSSFVNTSSAQTVGGVKTFSSQIANTVASGTAPLKVTSNTLVSNLNADMVDGWDLEGQEGKCLVKTGYVRSTAADAESRWGMLASAEGLRTWARLESFLSIGSGFSEYGVIVIDISANATKITSAKLWLISGNLTTARFRLYWNATSRSIYLMVDSNGQWGFYNAHEQFTADYQTGLKSDVLTLYQKSNVTEDELDAVADLPYVELVNKSDVVWENITSTPTTLSGYGCTDGVNAIATSGSGNVVTAASVSGHTLTLTKGATALTTLTKGTTSGSGNAVTDISVSGGTVTLTKGSTFLTSHQSLDNCVQSVTGSKSGDVVTDISKSGSALTVTKGYAIQHPAALLSGSCFTATTLASSSCEKVTKVVMRTADSSIWWGLNHGALLVANMYGINSGQMCVLNTAKTAVMLSVIKYDSTKFWLYDHSVGKMVRLGTSGVLEYGDIAGTSVYHLWTLVADTSTNANGVQIKSCAGSYYLALTSSGVSVKTSAASPAWNIDVLTAVTGE